MSSPIFHASEDHLAHIFFSLVHTFGKKIIFGEMHETTLETERWVVGIAWKSIPLF